MAALERNNARIRALEGLVDATARAIRAAELEDPSRLEQCLGRRAHLLASLKAWDRKDNPTETKTREDSLRDEVLMLSRKLEEVLIQQMELTRGLIERGKRERERLNRFRSAPADDLGSVLDREA